MARGFSGKNREGGWRAGGLAAGTPGGVRDATAGVRPPGEGGTVGRQVSTSGARAYTARCPLPGSVECPVLASPPPWGVRPSVRLSVCPSLERLLLGGPCCRCSLRDPLGGAGAQRGGFSGTRRASAGAALKKLQHRRAWGATVVQTWVQQVWLGGAGAGAARGWPALAGGLVEARVRGARGVCLRKGGCEGADRKVGERGLALSLSLRFVFSTLFYWWCALHLALGAICRFAVVGSTLADSDSVSSALPCPRWVRRRPRVTYSGTGKASAGGPADCIRA